MWENLGRTKKPLSARAMTGLNSRKRISSRLFIGQLWASVRRVWRGKLMQEGLPRTPCRAAIQPLSGQRNPRTSASRALCCNGSSAGSVLSEFSELLLRSEQCPQRWGLGIIRIRRRCAGPPNARWPGFVTQACPGPNFDGGHYDGVVRGAKFGWLAAS